jgi:hypothetical protein
MPASSGKGVYFVSGKGAGALLAYDSRSRMSAEVFSGTASMPTLSPDGKRVLYTRYPEPGRIEEIWISDLDGSKHTKLFSSGVLTPGSWSPDGARVTFWDDTSGESKAFIVGVDGRGQRSLAPVPGEMVNSAWSRDDRFLYMVSLLESKWVLWKLPLDGSPPERLAEDCLMALSAAPDGNYLLGRCAPAERPPGICAYALEEGSCLPVTPEITTSFMPTALDSDAVLYAVSGRGETIFYKAAWKDGTLVGQLEISLRVPLVFPESQGYFGSSFDYTPDLSTIVYARPAGQADLYFLGSRD